MTGTLHLHPDGDSRPGSGPRQRDPVDPDLAAGRILRLLAHERRTALTESGVSGKDVRAPE